MKETREQKFKRLAEARVNRMIHELRLLGNLSNRTNYVYEKKDINTIFKALEEELEIAKLRFSSSPRIAFTLDKLPAKVKPQLPKITIKPLPIKVSTVAPCSNCFENRALKPYKNLNLCKKCYRKRKTIGKIRAHNGALGKGTFVK